MCIPYRLKAKEPSRTQLRACLKHVGDFGGLTQMLILLRFMHVPLILLRFMRVPLIILILTLAFNIQSPIPQPMYRSLLAYQLHDCDIIRTCKVLFFARISIRCKVIIIAAFICLGRSSRIATFKIL